jgi:ADP-heptose:LPS heptosyltransferase
MHIACAVKTPLVALFKPGEILKFSPSYNNVPFKILSKEVKCSSSCGDRFYCKRQICMELISVEEVVEAARELLK